MKISVEITLYPLNNDYIPPIEDFIKRLKSHADIKVLGNTMSTQVFGEYMHVLKAIQHEMHLTHQQVPKAAFVMKVLGGDLSPQD